MIIATVNQAQVNLSVLATTQEGIQVAVASGTVRIFTIDEGAEVDVLAATALVNISGSRWAYEWEPATLPAGQYHVEYILTDADSNAYPSQYELAVLSMATPENVVASQAAIQADVVTVQAGVDSANAAIAAVGAVVDATSAAIVTLQTDATFLKQVSSGRWRIVSNQMIIYDTDGTTPALTFNLLDSNGDPTMEDPTERVPVG